MSKQRTSCAPGRRAFFRPTLENLEDRTLLSSAGFADSPSELVSLLGPRLAATRSAAGSPEAKLEGTYRAALQAVGQHIGEPLSGALGRVRADGTLQTYLHLADWQAGVSAIHSRGIAIEAANEAMRIVQAWIQSGQAEELAGLPSIASIGLPDYAVPRTGSVTSAGDVLQRADAVRARFGATGGGVKVGIISDGADAAAYARVAGSPYFDLPSLITVDAARPGHGVEGLAMMEILYDIAPGARFYFSGPATSVEMIASINWMVSQGVQVIVDDVGFYQEPFFAHGPLAQAVAQAVARGITYVTAAGNDASDHYQAGYVQGPAFNSGFLHDFGGGDIGQTVTIAPGATFTAFLQWSDPFGASTNDYDLYLVRSSDGIILTSSVGFQTGIQDPREIVIYKNTSSTPLTAFVAINKFRGAARELELFTFGDSYQQYVTPSDSLFSQAALPEVLTVGAMNAASVATGTVAAYSSQGPATIYTDFASQTKMRLDSLDGVGIDGVETKLGQLGLFANPFYGTSAAAPHVAGLAALLLQIHPGLTPAALAAALDATATDLTRYGLGYDATSGFGLFDALPAAYAVLTPPLPDLTAASDTGLSNSDNVTRLTTLTFTGAVPAGSFVHLYVDGQEWGTQQLGSNVTTSVLSVGPLAPGAHQITVRVAPSAAALGLSQPSVPLNVVIDTAAPLSHVLDVTPNPRTTPLDQIGIVFTEAVYGFSRDDLRLSRDGSPDLLTEGQALSSSDRLNWVLSNLTSRTGTPGTYTLLLPAATAGITDLAGNPLVMDAATNWVVTAVPHPISLEAESRTNTAGVLMARAHASMQQTVWLHAWELINVPFIVDAAATYAVSLRYSNDNNGPLESSLVWLDDTLIGSAVLQDTGDFGQGWDSFQSTGPMGSQALAVGRHVLTFLVYGGDGFGAEADVFTLSPSSGPFLRQGSIYPPSGWWALLGPDELNSSSVSSRAYQMIVEVEQDRGSGFLQEDHLASASTRVELSSLPRGTSRQMNQHRIAHLFGWEDATEKPRENAL